MVVVVVTLPIRFEKYGIRSNLLPQKPSEIASDQSVSSSKGGVLGIVFN